MRMYNNVSMTKANTVTQMPLKLYMRFEQLPAQFFALTIWRVTRLNSAHTVNVIYKLVENLILMIFLVTIALLK